MFNINEMIIDRPVRAHMYDFDGKRRWTATQIKDPNLECGGETVYATDAIGTNIMAFDRSKTASFSFSNALMNLAVMADQLGAEPQVATETEKLKFHCFEFVGVEVTEDGATATLTHVPYEEVTGAPFKYIDKVSGDNTTIATYELGASADTNFSVNGSVITLPTGGGWQQGDRIAVKYIYEGTSGVAIDDNSDAFGEYGEFMIEVLAYNPCDRATKRAVNIIFPNAKCSNNFSMTLNNELTHPVTIEAMPDYCSVDKLLFRVEALA